MALPIIMFAFLTLLGIATLILGVKSNNLKAGFGLLIFSSTVFILTGLFLQINGLELTTVASATVAGSVTSYTYQSISYSDSWLRILADFLLYGGFGVIILSFVSSVKHLKSRNADMMAFPE